MKKLVLIVLILCLTETVATAQTYNADKHVGIENGLSNNFILDIAIDKRGCLWVATESGLNSINGNIVTSYNNYPTNNFMKEDIHSVSYNEAHDQVLIGTDLGLAVYDCPKATFRYIGRKEGLLSAGVNDIAAASDGGAWIIEAKGYVEHFDCETFKLTKLRLPTLYSNRCAMEDNNGHLFIGHIHDGLTIVDLKNHKSKHFTHNSNDPKSLPGNLVRCIYQDEAGEIWIGTEHGLALYNPQEENFTRVTHTDGYSDDNVFCIKEMKDGYLWAGSDMGGISAIDLRKLRSDTRFRERPVYDNSLNVTMSSINTRALEQDEFGNIWIGNHSTGIDFIPNSKPIFNILSANASGQPLRRTYGITSDHKGNVWIGGEDELLLYKDGRLAGSWQITGGKRRQHSFAIYLLADKKDNVWLGMEDEGLIKFDTRQQKFERIELEHSSLDIRSIYEDTDGTMWIGSEYGLYKYADGKASTDKYATIILKGQVVTATLRLSRVEMLFATLGRGVYIINTTNGSSQHIGRSEGLPSGKVNHAIMDSHGGIWIATSEGIAYIRDWRNINDIKVYGDKQGLAENNTRALQQDRNGRIWVSTLSGISCLDTRKDRFYNYNHRSNLPSGSFVSGAATTLPDGTMFFDSPSGVCCFNPMSVNNKQKVSDVRIALCQAYNPTGKDTEIINLMPDNQGRCYASYQQNTIRIAFAVKDYAQNSNVEYSYMMKGLNDTWYYIGNDYDVVFRGLDPGQYTFVLRAKLNEQDWADASTTQIGIYIKPPLWRTWWAYLLYLLLISSIVWYLLHSYKRRLKLKNSLEIEIRENAQKQELNEERLQFFTNITHELRTPLTMILGPLEDLTDDKRMPEVYHKKVSVIYESAKRLRNLINEILDFRKVETNNRRLVVAKDDLGDFVKEMGLRYKQLNRNPKLTVNIDIEQNLPKVYFDSEAITTIVNNLLSNAFKYTKEGEIVISVRADKAGHVVIMVKDTGTGISREALPHIFDRYYQANGKHQASGTGIGLSLVKSLIELHEGHISVESSPGKGSKFTITLDTDNTYPNALHKDDKESTVPDTSHAEQEEEKAQSREDDASDVRPLLLIVEDNNDIRQYIAESMGDDYRVIQATDGQEGLRLTVEHVPDIIVSDIMMPNMDGIEMTKRIKEDIRTSHIPIILLTAKDTVRDKEEGYDSGAYSYLTKPFSAKLLQSRIRNLLANRRRLAELISFQNTGIKKTKEKPLPEDEPHLNRLDKEFIDKMNKVIEDNITTEDLNMDFMSSQMAMSYSTFYRKVKALMGMTAKEYIRKRKLQKSAELLQSGDYNVTEAATMTGFNDLNNFRIIFKKEFGVPPSDYKQKGRSNP